jgi:hypothetical protein
MMPRHRQLLMCHRRKSRASHCRPVVFLPSCSPSFPALSRSRNFSTVTSGIRNCSQRRAAFAAFAAAKTLRATDHQQRFSGQTRFSSSILEEAPIGYLHDHTDPITTSPDSGRSPYHRHPKQKEEELAKRICLGIHSPLNSSRTIPPREASSQ